MFNNSIKHVQLTEIYPGLTTNEMQALYDKHHKVSSLIKFTKTHIMLCQIWSNMKIANNPVKYAVVIEQYLHSILDISDQKHWQTLLTLGASLQTYIPLFQFLKWSKVHFF